MNKIIYYISTYDKQLDICMIPDYALYDPIYGKLVKSSGAKNKYNRLKIRRSTHLVCSKCKVSAESYSWIFCVLCGSSY